MILNCAVVVVFFMFCTLSSETTAFTISMKRIWIYIQTEHTCFASNATQFEHTTNGPYICRSDISCARIAHYILLHHGLNTTKKRRFFTTMAFILAIRCIRKCGGAKLLFCFTSIQLRRNAEGQLDGLYVNLSTLCYGCSQGLLHYLPLFCLTTVHRFVDHWQRYRRVGNDGRIRKSVFSLITTNALESIRSIAQVRLDLCACVYLYSSIT